jgi:hypothetical protein
MPGTASDIGYIVNELDVGHYATSQKVAGSRPYEVNEFVSIYLVLPVTLGPGIYSAPKRNEYQKKENNDSGE